VAGHWRRLHNEELHNLYASPSTIRVIKWRRIRWVGHLALMGKTKRPLGRPRHRWEDNI
jgi:hypothetical protein